MFNFLGRYPNCTCTGQEAGYTFSSYINKCYIECPEDAEDIHPYCRCNERFYYYNIESKFCETIEDRKCPAASIGIGPDCLCIKKDYVFNKLLWECYHKFATFAFPSVSNCPDSTQKWPQCDVSIDRNTLLSLIG